MNKTKIKGDMDAEKEISKALHKRDDLSGVKSNEKERAELVLGLLPLVKFGKVLDIGCGLGTCMRMLKHHSEQVIGLDIHTKKYVHDLNKIPYPFNGRVPFRRFVSTFLEKKFLL